MQIHVSCHRQEWWKWWKNNVAEMEWISILWMVRFFNLNPCYMQKRTWTRHLQTLAQFLSRETLLDLTSDPPTGVRWCRTTLPCLIGLGIFLVERKIGWQDAKSEMRFKKEPWRKRFVWLTPEADAVWKTREDIPTNVRPSDAIISLGGEYPRLQASIHFTIFNKGINSPNELKDAKAKTLIGLLYPLIIFVSSYIIFICIIDLFLIYCS